MFMFVRSYRLGCLGGGGGCRLGVNDSLESSADCLFQICASNPVIFPGLSVVALGAEFALFGGDQVECALLHRVILEDGFVDDADALREVNLLVKFREITGGKHGIASLTNFRPNVGGQRFELPLGLAVLGSQLRDGGLSLIEDWQLQVEDWTGDALPVGRALGIHTEINRGRQILCVCSQIKSSQRKIGLLP